MGLTTPYAFKHREAILPTLTARGQGLQLAAAPAILCVFYALEQLKYQLTKKHTNELYTHIWKFISKAEARDKVGRVVQYFCRFLQGVCNHAAPTFFLQPWKSTIAEVQTTLAWARRTNRWGKEMPHIPVFAEAIQKGDWLEAVQRAILISFLVQDHIYWLLKMGILKFEGYTAIQWHRRNLRFIMTSHVFNFMLCFREIRRLNDKLRRGRLGTTNNASAPQLLHRLTTPGGLDRLTSPTAPEAKDQVLLLRGTTPEANAAAAAAAANPQNGASSSGLTKEVEKKIVKDIQDNRTMMLRYVLTFFQMMHVSQTKVLDDWYVGLMGCVSSAIDARRQW